MSHETSLRHYRKWYAKLLRLYPSSYRARFGEAMEQTFHDLCRERAKADKGMFRFVLWMFLETSAAIVRENAARIMHGSTCHGTTLFLRLVISVIAIAAVAACAFPLPRMIAKEAAKTPDTAWQIYLFLVGAYVQAALFLFALFQAFKLLSYIDRDKAFSEPSVRALRHIKLSAASIGLLMATGVTCVLVLSAGTGEDSAGPVALGLMGTFASSVVTAAAAVLQQLVQKGIDATKESHL